MMSGQHQRIIGYFIEEAIDHLNTLEQGLLDLQGTIEDPEKINQVFRAAHCIKGGAAMLGFLSIQKTAYRLERCFQVFNACPVRIDQKLESLLQRVLDTLKALMQELSWSCGLNDELTHKMMSKVEPVFEELNNHLNHLFIEGTKEYIQTIEQGLLSETSTIKDAEEINQLFCAAHSIKSGAAMLGLTSIQETAHHLEKGFQVIKEYPIQVDQKLDSFLLRLLKTLQALWQQLQRALGLTEEITGKIMSEVEPVFQELDNHLRLLVIQAGFVRTNLTLVATAGTQRIDICGYFTVEAKCTLKVIRQAVSKVGGRITGCQCIPGAINDHFFGEPEGINDQLSIGVWLPTFSCQQELRDTIPSEGGVIETVHIEALQTCRRCRFYYGQCEIVCAVHPSGPKEEPCRDWEQGDDWIGELWA
ncbi:Hpt domain-containing protein [Coleofasciculus sp. FACHB-SPT9]|uniref:Hpt domain-containing protein n=1 Tax=Cyanophyceae TaxID=3028117 RepID=UPI001687087D|nr:Hpt domain-containing protein [Coleofasciculus sp. FACHB-SPT9]MBD1888151.1 Hpt domain-containing protein [Coleofasciculus sp. FACHB-SPT9]